VPDFIVWGAMENIAAVTFNEKFVQRDGRDRDEELKLAETIGHEMAHMWFGNLVTMRWWNGLWLNESFAKYMGIFVAELIGYPEAWEVFFRGSKQDAYDIDRRVTTHALETPVATTDEVYDNWDAISYAKGASVLRQATLLLGGEAFRDGIRIYLPRHAEGNTGVDDFLAALSEASERDLRQWAREWLFTPGVNTVTAEYSCVNGRVDSFSLVQGAPADHPALRSQRVQVGFFQEVDGSVVTSGVMPVTYAGKRTGVPAAVGKPCPTLVYPNLRDHGYVIVELDPRTRANLTRSIGDIRDSFPRMMFWATLLDAARLGVLPIPEYLDAVLGAGRAESDRVAIEQIYGGAAESLRALRSMGEAGADAHTHYALRIETMLWERLVEAEPEAQSLFFNLYLRATSTKEGLARHVALLDNELMVPGLSVDQDRRWRMLNALSKAGRTDALARARAELERDDSARGRRNMIIIESLYPDAAAKEERLDALFDRGSEMTLADMGATAAPLFVPGQEKLHDQFARRIIAELSAIEARAEPGTLQRARLRRDFSHRRRARRRASNDSRRWWRITSTAGGPSDEPSPRNGRTTCGAWREPERWRTLKRVHDDDAGEWGSGLESAHSADGEARRARMPLRR